MQAMGSIPRAQLTFRSYNIKYFRYFQASDVNLSLPTVMNINSSPNWDCQA